MDDVLFVCPQCGGVHFNISSGGTLICTSWNDQAVIGCGWRGRSNVRLPKEMPRRWEDMPQNEQKSCYWVVMPDNTDSILDGLDYEIVYVYFDGAWCVMRPRESKTESLSSFRFISPVVF